jgi:hypothetical protein
MADESLGSIQVDRLLPAHQQPEQMVKPREMIDMGMRNEDMVQALDLARRESGNITQVEKDRAPFE